MPGGRPPKYNEELIPIAVTAYEFGASDKEVAKKLGIAESTLYEWKKEHKEFSEPIKEAKDKYDCNMLEGALMKSALGHEGPDGKYYPPNPTMGIFLAKNRMKDKYRDRVEHDHKGKFDHEVKITVRDDATAEAFNGSVEE